MADPGSGGKHAECQTIKTDLKLAQIQWFGFSVIVSLTYWNFLSIFSKIAS